MIPPEHSSMPAVAHCPQCRNAIGIAVRRANLAVKLFASVQVVIHLVDTTVLQLLCLLGCQQAQARANLQAVLLLDLGHDLGDGGHLALVGATG